MVAGTGAHKGLNDHRFLALDSLRGIAASMVVLYHFPSSGVLTTLGLVKNGFLFVTFFFVLSGFVICATYGQRLAQGFSLLRFMALRLGRIYPIHIFMLGAFVLYEILRAALGWQGYRPDPSLDGQFSFNGLLSNILLLQGFEEELTWNKPSWSIGVEYWTYLLFAIGAAVLGWRWKLFPVAVLLAVPAVVAIVLHIDAAPWMNFLRCMYCFGAGMVAFMLWQHQADRRWSARLSFVQATLLEICVVVVMLFLIASFGGKLSEAVTPAFTAAVLIFSLEGGALSRFLKTFPMIILGTLSYSIYMVHQFVQFRLLEGLRMVQGEIALPFHMTESGRLVLLGNPLACDLATLAMLGLVLCTAWLTFNYVEEPARQWSRKVIAKAYGARGAELKAAGELVP